MPDILALLIEERDKFDRAIAALQGPKRRGRPPGSTSKKAPKKKRSRPPMSAAQREAASIANLKRATRLSLRWEKQQAAKRHRVGSKIGGKGKNKAPLKAAEPSRHARHDLNDTRIALAKRADVSRHKIDQATAVKRHDEKNGTRVLDRGGQDGRSI